MNPLEAGLRKARKTESRAIWLALAVALLSAAFLVHALLSGG